MKKILVAGTLLLLIVALAGCGSPEPPSTTPDADSPASSMGQVVEVDAKRVEELIQTDADLVIIDASGKWADGHLVGALDTPLDKLQDIINSRSVALNASKHYVVYSHDEASSKAAADMLIKNSFMVVYRLVGGYDAWVAYGGYIEK